MIVGTLKATELYRAVLEVDRVVHRETLLAGFGRIRDIEVGSDGYVYLLIEHAWLILTSALALVYRGSPVARTVLIAMPVLAVLAAAIAIYKQF